MFDPNASQITITETEILLRGAAAPAPIVDRRIDGRLLVAAPGKKNRWLVLDGAFVPALLAKRIKAPSKVVEERIVVPVEDLDATVALVEAWVVGGGKEADEAAAAKRAATAAKRAATLAAKAEAERQAKWDAEAPARAAAAAARAEVERARQARWAEERRARELEAAAARRAEDARMAQIRANRAVVEVAYAPAVGEAFGVQGDEMWHSDSVMICESLGRSWMRGGVEVCYAYGRPATAEEAAAYHADRARSGHDILRIDRAPAVGDRFKLRDGTYVVCTAVGRPYRVDDSLDEDYTSFYSSELWEQDVVRVDYEYLDAPDAPAMVQQPVQQQQVCAAGAKVGMGFEAALADRRAAAATGFLSFDDPSMRLERALAWADDLNRAGMIDVGVRDRLHVVLRAGAEETL
ncbi:hypothetical protein E8E01_00350 [Methylorubrum populi]|uniref:hypothetical protein n=1 Tax=Methylorubrum populi TaxID=223967 RepID=UPI00114E49D1|nr:hypothetical protein [Methylorubrum populi]QDI79006.1 hypothetical protein E8E01_00350 [Methylorubrum populi]